MKVNFRITRDHGITYHFFIHYLHLHLVYGSFLKCPHGKYAVVGMLQVLPKSHAKMDAFLSLKQVLVLVVRTRWGQVARNTKTLFWHCQHTPYLFCSKISLLLLDAIISMPEAWLTSLPCQQNHALPNYWVRSGLSILGVHMTLKTVLVSSDIRRVLIYLGINGIYVNSSSSLLKGFLS